MKNILLFFMLIFTSSSIYSQASMGGGLGSISIDGKIWNKISLRPELPLGPVGIGFDIVLYIDAEGNIRKDDWDFKDNTSDAILDKIMYVRYGKPTDNIYVRAGSLENVTFGYGILVKNYTNMLDYPANRQLGFQSKTKFGPLETEVFVANIKVPGLVGARARLDFIGNIKLGASIVSDFNQLNGLKDRDGDGYPDKLDYFPDEKKYVLDSDGDGLADRDVFQEFDIDGDGIFDQEGNFIELNNFWDQVASTGVVVDDSIRNRIPDGSVATMTLPFNIDNSPANSFTAIAFDVGYDMDVKFGKLGLYSQVAKFMGQAQDESGITTGWGMTPFGVSFRQKFIDANLEYRLFSDYFVAGYFDRSYDLNRSRIIVQGDSSIIETRDEFYLQTEAVKGVYGEFNLNVFDFLTLGSEYQFMKSENDTLNSFGASLEIPGGIIPKLSSARAYYIQNNEINPFNFEKTESTMLGYNIDMALSEGVVLRFKYQENYKDLNGDGKIKGENETIVITGVETVFAF